MLFGKFNSVVYCVCVAVFLSACARKESVPPVTVSKQQIFEHKCALSFHDKDRLRCFDFYTRVDKQGFRIPVVVIKNFSRTNYPPVVYLPGGPGATYVSHSDSVAYWMSWLDSLALERDLVLFDLRGAAAGEPTWKCNNYEEISKELLRKNISVDEESSITHPILERCLQSFDKKLQRALAGVSRKSPGSALRTISTRNYAEDVGNIMENLGYKKWSILASSYGTRLAMQVAATHPEVDKLLLDSPYPAGRGQLDDAFRVWVAAFELLFKKYQEQNVEELYWRTIERLKERPIKVSVQNWETNAEVKWLLNDARLNWVLYQAMYSRDLFVLIPTALQGLSEGDSAPAQPLLESFYNNAFDRFFNSMIFVATECNDNLNITREAFEHALQSSPKWAHYFQKDWQYNICASDLFESKMPLLKSRFAQPTLVVAGELDPITNADYARDTLALADNAHLLYASGLSHAEFIDSECGMPIIAQFFKSDKAMEVARLKQEFEHCLEALPY